MTKVYFIAPLIALAIFAGIYSSYAQAYHARIEQDRQVALEKKRRKQEEDAQAQQRAHREASEALARRQAERAEKDRLDAAQKQARQDAEQRRTTLALQETTLRVRLDRLRGDVTAVGESVQRRELDIRELERERVFLADYVTQAEANRISLYALLEKFETTEAQRSALAAAGPKSDTRR